MGRAGRRPRALCSKVQDPGRGRPAHFQRQFENLVASDQEPDLWRGSPIVKGDLVEFSRVKHEAEREIREEQPTINTGNCSEGRKPPNPAWKQYYVTH